MTTQFQEDLTRNAHYEEPKASSNAGMHFALALALVLSVVFIIWAIAQGHGEDERVGFSNQPAPRSSNGSSTVYQSQSKSVLDEKSYASGQQVQASAP